MHAYSRWCITLQENMCKNDKNLTEKCPNQRNRFFELCSCQFGGFEFYSIRFLSVRGFCNRAWHFTKLESRSSPFKGRCDPTWQFQLPTLLILFVNHGFHLRFFIRADEREVNCCDIVKDYVNSSGVNSGVGLVPVTAASFLCCMSSFLLSTCIFNLFHTRNNALPHCRCEFIYPN